MKEYQIDEYKKLGFNVIYDRDDILIEMNNIPDLSLIKRLIILLTFKDELNYWDSEYKSPSDPGAYVSAIRYSDETFAYRVGNHGWISNWEIISIDEMAKRIRKNWDKDCDYGKYLNRIKISQNKHITRSNIDSDKVQ